MMEPIYELESAEIFDPTIQKGKLGLVGTPGPRRHLLHEITNFSPSKI